MEKKKNKFSSKIMHNSIARRMTSMAVMATTFGASAYAQAAGVTAIQEATQTFEHYLPQVQKLMYAIGAIIAIVGAFSVFFKMQNGDQDVKKSIMMTVGGCIAFVALATALPSFFK